ncbi:hypothetical protein BH10PLA1_BH10PLA1_13840 [soil metagenome]
MANFQPLKDSLIEQAAGAAAAMASINELITRLPEATNDEIMALCEGENNVFRLMQRAVRQIELAKEAHVRLRTEFYRMYSLAKKNCIPPDPTE